MKKQQHAPRWLWLLLGGGILGYLGWVVAPMIHCHYSGKEAMAVITNVTTRTEGGGGPDSWPRQVKYYTLSFDGHSVEKRTSGSRDEGEKVPVIYLPGDPDSVVCGARADGPWRTIARSTNERNLMIAAGLGLFFLFAAAKKTAPQTGLK